MEGARSILLSITGGADLSLVEVSEAAKVVGEAAHPDANIIFGANVDEELTDQVWVTVVATRFDGRPRAAAPRRRADDPPHQGRAAAAARARRARRASSAVDVPEFLPGLSRRACADERGRRSRPPAHRRGGRRGAARGRQRGRRRGLRGARLVRGREPADRLRRRRLHDRPHAGGGDDADRLLRRRPRARRDRARRGAGPGRRPLRRRDACRCSTSAPPPAACPAPRPASRRRWSASARCRWPSWSGPGSRLAREGAPVNRRAGLHARHPRADPRRGSPGTRELYAPAGPDPARGRDVFRFPELAEALERFGAEGAEPFYRGEIGRRASPTSSSRDGGTLGAGDLAAYEPIEREPIRRRLPRHRGADQPAALLGRDPDRLLPRAARAARRASGPSSSSRRWARPTRAAARRSARGSTSEGLRAPSFARPGRASTLAAGATCSARPPTSRSLDADGCCASVTCSNGSGSGVLVPGHRRASSTTCSARRTSTRSASTRSRRGAGCPR